MNRLPRSIKYILVALFLALIVAGNWLGVSTLRIYRANLGELKTALSPWKVAGHGERVLVIAPHCDDETLACGGEISRLVRDGAQVKVVLVTNGDGYYELMRKLRLAGSKSYIAFGIRRQKESRAALRLLGVPESQIVFLGYPDRGVAAMWLSHWDKDDPFKSRYTKCSRSPYESSYRHDAPFCGRYLLDDLESIIRSYRPTTIYYPHPSDQHSDHWAVHCFVNQALYELGMLDEVRTGLYLVHRGDWPIPQGLHPTLPLRPPASLADIGMRWYGSGVSKDDAARKLRAIRLYRSQTPILGDFMRTFARNNELFGSYAPGTISRVDLSPGEQEETAWQRVSPCIADPVGDSLRVDVGRAGDIRFVRCYYDAQEVHVRIELEHPHSRRMNYGIEVCGLPDSTAGRVHASITTRGRVTVGMRAVRSGNMVDFAVPMARLGKWNALLVCADSSIEKKKVDRTAWRLLLRDQIAAKSLRNPGATRSLQARRQQASPARKPL